MTPEQLLERKSGIGASEVAVIFGQSPYQTPYDLWLDKISDEVNPHESYHLERGKYLEPFILAQYCKRTGLEAHLIPDLFRHPQYGFLICHIDAVAYDLNDGSMRLVEMKSAMHMRKEDWGDEGSDEIPPHYFLQCAHEALVYSAAQQVDIAGVDLVVDTGFSLKIFHYDRNPAMEEAIIQECDEFWHLVEAKIPPVASSYAEVTKKYQEAIGNYIVADEQIELNFWELAEIKRRLKELMEDEDRLKTNIGEFMKDHSYLVDSAGRELLTWKNQTSSRVDLKSLRESHAVLCEQFTRKDKSRVMRIKEVK